MIEKDAIIHRYESLSNATNDAIWDLDLLTNKVFYNERIPKIFGYSSVELQNNTNWWENNIHPDDKDRVLKKVNFYLTSTRSSWNDEYRFKCKDGTYKIIYDRSFIVRDDAQQPIRLIGAMKDITRARNMEMEKFQEHLKNKNLIGKSIIQSHEAERKMLKDDLHEDVSQLLATVKLNLEKTGDEFKNKAFQESVQYLDQAIDKIKKISGQLLSSSFEYFGLEEAVYTLFEMYNDIEGLDLSLDSSNFNENKLDKSISLLLYRFIEHKLSVIILKLDPKSIQIKISNNSGKVHMNILFQTYAANAIAILNDHSVMDMHHKLEMYEGELKISLWKNHFYDIEVKI